MGYFFKFYNSPYDAYNFNDQQMGIVREIMREAGAAGGQGLEQALRVEGLEPTEQTVDMKKFLSNDNWHVTEDEALFIASRLRLAVEKHVPSDLACFFDDAPAGEEVNLWTKEFADFNEHSVAAGGYHVN